jgi:hypothetical protein
VMRTIEPDTVVEKVFKILDYSPIHHHNQSPK